MHTPGLDVLGRGPRVQRVVVVVLLVAVVGGGLDVVAVTVTGSLEATVAVTPLVEEGFCFALLFALADSEDDDRDIVDDDEDEERLTVEGEDEVEVEDEAEADDGGSFAELGGACFERFDTETQSDALEMSER